MKKTLLVGLLLAFTATLAGAQNPTTVVDLGDDGDLGIIPAVMTRDGKAAMYAYRYDERSFSILDDNFNVTETFSVAESLLDKYDMVEDMTYATSEYGSLAQQDNTFSLELSVVKDLFGPGFQFFMCDYDASAIRVFNSKNKEIASMSIPDGYDFDSQECSILKLGDTFYFLVRLYVGEESEGSDHKMAFYRIDNNGSGASLVAIAPAAKVSPRAPRKGETVTVTIDSEMVNSGCMVQVVSASGQTVLDTKVPAGQSQLDINTSSFSKGVYVVNVSENGVSKENAKIIIR